MAQQGDQYIIPFKIRQGERIITPTLCDDVRIAIGDKTLQYSQGEVTFDDEKQTWGFSITQEETRNLDGSVPYQVGVKIADQIIYSQVRRINVLDSLIQEDW